MLTDLVRDGRVLVVTGAGISTDSGIPDYRGPTGQRRHDGPMTFQQFTGSAEARRRYWARSHVGWRRVARARPNGGHLAVADLERHGLLTGVVTQNVDGLHAAAGSREVVDLHGRLDRVVCLDCDERRPRLELALRLDVLNPTFGAGVTADAAERPDGDVVLPEAAVERFRVAACRRCGGVLKPDVVFFGEHVPRERFRRALGLLDRSSALLVLGSSLTVGSGYRFVTAAVRRSLPVAIVNRGVTRGDMHATVKVDAGITETLAPLTRTLTPRTRTRAPRTRTRAPRTRTLPPHRAVSTSRPSRAESAHDLMGPEGREHFTPLKGGRCARPAGPVGPGDQGREPATSPPVTPTGALGAPFTLPPRSVTSPAATTTVSPASRTRPSATQRPSTRRAS